jgi:hypothetical protein
MSVYRYMATIDYEPVPAYILFATRRVTLQAPVTLAEEQMPSAEDKRGILFHVIRRARDC